MKTKLFLIISLLVSMMFISCAPVKDLTPKIVPLPQSLEVGNGDFTITPQTKLHYDSQLEEIENVISYFNGYLKRSSGFELESSETVAATEASISFKFNENIKNSEGYELTVDKEGITISASSSKGIFYGIQTILQLLPEEI